MIVHPDDIPPPANEVAIIGATSRLAQAIGEDYAKRGYVINLLGRDSDELRRIAANLTVLHAAKVRIISFEASSAPSIDAAAQNLLGRSALLRDLVFVIGLAEDLDRAHRDVDLAERTLASNYGAIIRFLARLMPQLEQERNKRIVFVSSVAGDRGRKTNFVYGAAKAALTTYAQGLRAALLPFGHQVLTIKLGYVDTRLAFGKTPAFLTPHPTVAARSVIAAIERGKLVAYIPSFWRVIMVLLRATPEWIFIRLPIP